MARTLITAGKVLGITLLLFLVADFTASLIFPRSVGEKGIRHPVYHHDLRPDFNGTHVWGKSEYRVCTDANGFLISCGDVGKTARKDYDLAFLGDSFTEGVGVPYEDSFAGLYALRHGELAVANLGVSSYAPSIYLAKMAFLLDRGFSFKQVLVLPDISDIQDEACFYRLDPESGVVVNKEAPAAPPAAEKPASKRFRQEVRRVLAERFRFTNALREKLRALRKRPPRPAKSDEARSVPLFLEPDYERSAWTRNPQSGGYGPDGVAGGIAQALEAMRALKALLDKHGIAMSVAVYPWPGQLAHDQPGHPGVSLWEDFCRQEGCAAFIDANAFFFAEKSRLGLQGVLDAYFIPGDVHFNQNGNRALFEIIDKALPPKAVSP